MSYYIELSSLSRRKFYENGGDLVLKNPSIYKFQQYVDKSELIENIEFSWSIDPIRSAQSTSFEEALPGSTPYRPHDFSIQNVQFSLTDSSKQYSMDVTPTLPSPNFIQNITDKSSYHPYTEYGKKVKDKTFDLYLKENFRSIIISRTLSWNFYGDSWDTTEPIYLYLEVKDPQSRTHYYKVRIAAVIDYIPGADFSVMPFSGNDEIFISPDLFFEFNALTKRNLGDLEFKKVILHPKENANQEIKFNKNIIQKNVSSAASKTKKEENFEQESTPESQDPYEKIVVDLSIHSKFYNQQIFRLSDEAEEFANTEKMLDIIFNGTTFLVLVICFFNLTASMSSKISASRTQLGILRCLGMSKVRTALIFLYDSFLVVFCASVIGLIAGGFLAALLIMQRTLFMDIPMEFYVNAGNFVVIIVASFFSAFFSAFIPMMVFLKKPLSQISK